MITFFAILAIGCNTSEGLSQEEENLGISKSESLVIQNSDKKKVKFTEMGEKVKIVTMLIEDVPDKAFLSVRKDDNGGKQVAFNCSNKTYTAYYVPGEFLSFWVRPKGSKAKGLIKTFTDHDLDGTVDFGISGSESPEAPKPYRFIQEHPTLEDKLQTRAYWQKLYDEALLDAKHCIN